MPNIRTPKSVRWDLSEPLSRSLNALKGDIGSSRKEDVLVSQTWFNVNKAPSFKSVHPELHLALKEFCKKEFDVSLCQAMRLQCSISPHEDSLFIEDELDDMADEVVLYVQQLRALPQSEVKRGSDAIVCADFYTPTGWYPLHSGVAFRFNPRLIHALVNSSDLTVFCFWGKTKTAQRKKVVA